MDEERYWKVASCGRTYDDLEGSFLSAYGIDQSLGGLLGAQIDAEVRQSMAMAKQRVEMHVDHQRLQQAIAAARQPVKGSVKPGDWMPAVDLEKIAGVAWGTKIKPRGHFRTRLRKAWESLYEVALSAVEAVITWAEDMEQKLYDWEDRSVS